MLGTVAYVPDAGTKPEKILEDLKEMMATVASLALTMSSLTGSLISSYRPTRPLVCVVLVFLLLRSI